VGEQVRFEKVNEWLGRKPKNEPLGKMREKERFKIYLFFILFGVATYEVGDIRKVFG
jgi:hypothetical protein